MAYNLPLTLKENTLYAMQSVTGFASNANKQIDVAWLDCVPNYIR